MRERRWTRMVFGSVALAALLVLVVVGARAGPTPEAPALDPTLLVPGRSYWGGHGDVVYTPGTLPLVISAGHGGARRPDDVSDRRFGTTVTDRHTVELARALEAALIARLGRRPHVVVSHLARVKLDPNRPLDEATDGHPRAVQTWYDYHGFLDAARSAVALQHRSGLYLDLHGHGHEIAWTELGYLLDGATLDGDDAALRDPGLLARTSLRALAVRSGADLAALLRGADSLGAGLAARGYRAVPSPDDPGPRGRPYFSGGYSTRRHGSRDGGQVDGAQVEAPLAVRSTHAERTAYADALAAGAVRFLEAHDGWSSDAAPRITLRAEDPVAVEGGPVAEIRLRRDGPLDQALVIDLVWSGTADDDDTGPLPGTAVLYPGQTTVTLRVAARPDGRAERPETLQVALPPDWRVGVPEQATVVLRDPGADPSLAAHWPLDAVGSDRVVDASGHGRDGRLLPSGAAGPVRVSGPFGRALRFDGQDDAVTVAGFDYGGNGAFTVALWLRPDAPDGHGVPHVLSHGALDGPDGLHVSLIERAGLIRTVLRDADDGARPSALDGPLPLGDDRWHHYALTAAPDRLARVYIDGRLQARDAFGGAPLDPPGDLLLGARRDLDPERYFAGALDEVRLYDRALSAAEVRVLAAGRRDGPPRADGRLFLPRVGRPVR